MLIPLIVDFEKLKVRASRTTSNWPNLPFRRASVNSFGYGGSNAHVVLDEANAILEEANRHCVSSFASETDDIFSQHESDRAYVLMFSANDIESLRRHLQRLSKHLINPTVHIEPRDLAYTLSARRTHHFFRAYVLSNHSSFDEARVIHGKKRLEKAKIGFVFTGQGAQWSQMGQRIIRTFPVAQSMLTRLNNALQALHKPPLWSLEGKCWMTTSPAKVLTV